MSLKQIINNLTLSVLKINSAQERVNLFQGLCSGKVPQKHVKFRIILSKSLLSNSGLSNKLKSDQPVKNSESDFDSSGVSELLHV